MNRGLMILLLVSLAANVFLAGFVGGRVLGGPPHAKEERRASPLSGPGGMVMNRDLEILPPEVRETFRETFRAKKPVLRQSSHELRRLREAFAKSLAADDWDRAEVEASLEALRAAEGAHLSTLAYAMIDSFETLTPAQRKAVIEAQEKREQAWRERRKMRRHSGERPRGPRGAGSEEPGDGAPPAP